MVGPFTSNDTTTPELPLEAEPKRGLAGFLSSGLGKIVIGGVLVLVLAAVLGAIAFFYLFSQVPEDGGLILPTDSGTGSVTATQTPEVPVKRPSPRLSNSFTFRNVFRPTVRPAVEPSATTDASGTPNADLPADTLFLKSVTTLDGVQVATLLWNGQTFTAAEGDVLSGTPWQVLSIDGSTVVMLFGDSRVTLVVGQGVGK